MKLIKSIYILILYTIIAIPFGLWVAYREAREERMKEYCNGGDWKP